MTGSAETIAALGPAAADIRAMLTIESLDLTEGEPQSLPIDVKVML